MAKCAIHKNKESVRYCSDCGKSMCRDCVFQQKVATRVTRSTRYDTEYEHDFDFYCPNCFLNYGKERGYDLGSKGVFFRYKNSPSKIGLFILWGFFLMGFIVNFFFPIGYVLYAGTIISMIALKATASKNYQRFQNAQELLSEKPT